MRASVINAEMLSSYSVLKKPCFRELSSYIKQGKNRFKSRFQLPFNTIEDKNTENPKDYPQPGTALYLNQ